MSKEYYTIVRKYYGLPDYLNTNLSEKEDCFCFNTEHEANKCLRDEIFKETNLLNQVLKNNLIEIIQLIHKRNLKCSSVNNAETIWHDTVYTISDGAYFVDIMAKDGTIVMNYNCKANDGGGKKLCEKVHDLLDFDIIPYCERKKVELDV